VASLQRSSIDSLQALALHPETEPTARTAAGALLQRGAIIAAAAAEGGVAGLAPMAEGSVEVGEEEIQEEGSPPVQLEGGLAAWRDWAELAMSLDAIAP
jgi:hypothetical protein